MNHQLPEGMGSPARRALAAAGIETLEDLTKISEEELLKLHGMGPKALGVLRESMKAHRLGFASDENSDHVSLAANQKLPRCVPERKVK